MARSKSNFLVKLAWNSTSSELGMPRVFLCFNLSNWSFNKFFVLASMQRSGFSDLMKSLRFSKYFVQASNSVDAIYALPASDCSFLNSFLSGTTADTSA